MVCDGARWPLTFFLSPAWMSDANGALALPCALPPAKVLLADKGHDADWFREALEDKDEVPVPTRLYQPPVGLQSGKVTIAGRQCISNSILMPWQQVVAGFEPIMPSHDHPARVDRSHSPSSPSCRASPVGAGMSEGG